MAESFVRRVLRLSSQEGLVVSVMGPWGTGKTSFLNLASILFKSRSSPVIQFNPWLFSGAEQLVSKFFAELSAELRVRKLTVESDLLRSYGEALAGFDWIPVGGPWFRFFGGLLKLISSRGRPKGIESTRDKVTHALGALQHPIVVIIDDLDRLSTEEIRDIFRLVRLTASFPNIIYVLSFDRARVEQALAERGLEGRAYLEKILQFSYELPQIPDTAMRSHITSAIARAMNELPSGQRFDEDRWPDIFVDIIRPLVRHMRDLSRYATHIQGVLEELDGRVALEDVLAIEAIKVFLPDTYSSLIGAAFELTTASWSSTSGQGAAKQKLESIISDAGTNHRVVERLFLHVFPATQSALTGARYGRSPKDWSRKRYLADSKILDYYLTRVEGEAMVLARLAESAFEILAGGGDFEGFIRGIAPDNLEDVIASFEDYESVFTPPMAVAGAATLLSIVDTIPERPRGMFEFGAETTVRRIVLRLLRSEENSSRRFDLVSSIYELLTNLSAKRMLLLIVGHRENSGHKLISVSEEKLLEDRWRTEVKSSTVESLSRERDLLDIVLDEAERGQPGDQKFDLPSTPALNYQLLKSAWFEAKSQSSSERFVRRVPQLRWRSLQRATEGLDHLKLRIADARLVAESAGPIMELVDRHLSGWDPTDDDNE